MRKTKSKFGARLEPMSHVRLLLYRGRELDIVSQAESIEPLSPMLSSLDRASQGMAAIEAVDQLGARTRAQPAAVPDGGRGAAHDRRQAVAAQRLGVLLEAARRRARAPARRLRAVWRVRPRRGVRRVRRQRGRRPLPELQDGTPISPAALAIMRDILGGRLNEALALEESPATHEVSTLATRALEHHIERRLQAVAMFEAH